MAGGGDLQTYSSETIVIKIISVKITKSIKPSEVAGSCPKSIQHVVGWIMATKRDQVLNPGTCNYYLIRKKCPSRCDCVKMGSLTGLSRWEYLIFKYLIFNIQKDISRGYIQKDINISRRIFNNDKGREDNMTIGTEIKVTWPQTKESW